MFDIWKDVLSIALGKPVSFHSVILGTCGGHCLFEWLVGFSVYSDRIVPIEEMPLEDSVERTSMDVLCRRPETSAGTDGFIYSISIFHRIGIWGHMGGVSRAGYVWVLLKELATHGGIVPLRTYVWRHYCSVVEQRQWIAQSRKRRI